MPKFRRSTPLDKTRKRSRIVTTITHKTVLAGGNNPQGGVTAISA